MFDIAFSEILVIAVVALIVIGPERLPKTARTLGLLFGRLQRYVNEVKADISREMELDELRKLKQEVSSAAADLQSSMTAAVTDLQSNVRSVETELNQLASEGDGGAATSTTAGGAGAEAAPVSGTTVASASPGTASANAGAQAQPHAPHAPSQEVSLPDDVPGAPAREAEPEPPRQASLPGLERP